MTNSKPMIDTIKLKSEIYSSHPVFGFEKTTQGSVIITLLTHLQIELKEFEASKTTIADNLYQSVDEFRKVLYPLVSSADDTLSIKILHPLISFSNDSLNLEAFNLINYSSNILEVITTSKEDDSCMFVQAGIWIADLVHISTPYTFAQNLQQFLITGEIPND